MKIILSNHCKSLTGSLSKKHGYHIKRRGNNFFGFRNTKGHVPPNGHWLFIRDCAQMAQIGLIIANVQISWYELQSALYEAHHFVAARHVRDNYNDKAKVSYDARDIINLKTLFGL